MSPMMIMLSKPIRPNLLFRSQPKVEQPTRSSALAAMSRGKEVTCDAQKLVLEFDPKIPIEKAVTPPSSWYTDPSFYDLELQCVFYRGWQAVGYTEQVKEPHDFFTGRLGNVEYVVCRDDNGKISAFHNVCRHHASLLASGSGKKSCFVCPYHGWTYGLDGALRKATRITGVQDFNINLISLAMEDRSSGLYN